MIDTRAKIKPNQNKINKIHSVPHVFIFLQRHANGVWTLPECRSGKVCRHRPVLFHGTLVAVCMWE